MTMFRLSIAALVCVGVSTFASAGGFGASTERIGYTGSVSVYGSLNDALAGTNARYTNISWPQRDLAIFTVSGAPSFFADDTNSALSAWWLGNSPSNTNNGFIQLVEGAYYGNALSWTSKSGAYDITGQKFTLEVEGGNSPYPWSRLWNAGSPAGSGEATSGTFYSYEYELVADGLNAVYNPGDGLFWNTTNASNYSGYFKGIFENQSVNYPESDGFYVFDLTFNNDSWAVRNQLAGNDAFAGSVPGPAAVLPFLIGGIAMLRRRRK